MQAAAPAPPVKERPAAGRRVAVTISKGTTYLTSPLRPDGYVDYVAAVNARYGQGVTPENNAAVLLWKATGVARIDKAKREVRPI